MKQFCEDRRFSMMWRLWAVMLWSAVSASSTTASTGTLISSSEGRLPMSLSTIVADLEAHGECSEQLVTACFLSSRSVSRRKQATILQELLMGDDAASTEEQPVTVSTKACGLSSGLIVCRPRDDHEMVSTAAGACGGNVVYYADPIDLCRGEGLFDQLAPIMEQLLVLQQRQEEQSEVDMDTLAAAAAQQPLFSAPTLVVIVEYGDLSKARAAFEQVAEFFVSNLSSNASGNVPNSRRVQVLQDIFARVEYVASPAEAAQVLLATKASSPLTTLTVMDRIADAVALSSRSGGSSFSFSSPEDCAAAGLFGPAARVQVERVVQRIQQASVDNEGTTILVPSFGALVDAAVQQALDELPTIHQLSNQLLSSRIGKEIQSNFLSDVCAELGPLFQEQLDLLEKASFEDFRKALSRLLVSPNLKTDMDNVITTSVAAFGKAAQPLTAKQQAPLSSWQALVGPAKQRFRKRLQDFCHSRLLTAQASGQYRPLPRKGVTVGFHYLLPKPFGNDFRQEPWMVHATDNMVYIPKDGVTDVRPADVAAGDWRDKIVPSPVGNDMIYMQ